MLVAPSLIDIPALYPAPDTSGPGMEALAYAAYWLVSLLGLLQAVLVGIQTWEHRRFARRRLGELPNTQARGRALVIVPCRGAEPGLEENLRTVLGQDYPDYAVRFVVESPRDPACSVIWRAMRQCPHVDAEVVVAGRATMEGQKVHNLLSATADLPGDIEYLAFADSDARLRPQWLRALVARIEGADVVAATGYRWFVPVRNSLANFLVYSLNSCVAVFLGKNSPTVVWGGSWAIGRRHFESLGLRGAWQGMLDEDLVAGTVFRRAGLRVAFEPACMVATPVDHPFGAMLAFARRQYFLTRFYSRLAWHVIVLSTVLANGVFWANVAAAAIGFWKHASWAWLPASLAAALYGIGAATGYLRSSLAGLYFPELRHKLRGARWFEVWAGPRSTLPKLAAGGASAIGREVGWRGITYRLHADGRIAAIRRAEDAWPRGPHWPARDKLAEPSAEAPADATRGPECAEVVLPRNLRARA